MDNIRKFEEYEYDEHTGEYWPGEGDPDSYDEVLYQGQQRKEKKELEKCKKWVKRNNLNKDTDLGTILYYFYKYIRENK